MRKSRADIVKHFPMVLSQPPIISSPRDFLTMGWFPCSANPIPARVQSTLSPRGKAEEEDEDSLSQFILSVSFCHWPKGFGEGVRSSPLFGILGDPGSLTPAIWLPGIMDDPCTRCPERGGMADCKESLRSSVLIWKKNQKTKELWNEGAGMSSGIQRLEEAPLREFSAVPMAGNHGHSCSPLYPMDNFPALPSPEPPFNLLH